MENDNMRVVDLKALVKECGLRGYPGMSKADLIELLQSDPSPAPTQHTRPPRPIRPPSPPPPPILRHPQLQTWEPMRPSPSVRFRPDNQENPLRKKWIYLNNMK